MSTATPTVPPREPPDAQLQRMSVGSLHRWTSEIKLSPITTRRLFQRRETLIMHQLQVTERERAKQKLQQIQDKLVYLRSVQQSFPSRVQLEIDALLLFVRQRDQALPPPFSQEGGASQ